MRNFVRACLALAALPLFGASPSNFGARFPLTNVRYGPAEARQQKIVSDGRDLYLFWSTAETIYMTRLGDRAQISHKVIEPILPSSGQGLRVDPSYAGFDVVRFGTGFVVAAQYQSEATLAVNEQTILTAFVERDGQSFESSYFRGGMAPRLAWSGERLLLLYVTADSFVVRALAGTAVAGSTSDVLTGARGKTAAIAPAGNGVVAVAGNQVYRFDASGAFVSVAMIDGMADDAKVAVAGNDAGGYLVAWCDDLRCRAGNVELPGPVGETPSVTWNGDGWTVAYGTLAATLDTNATRVLSIEDVENGTQLVLSPDGRVIASFGPLPGHPAPVMVGELGQPAHVATYAGNEQTLLATTSSSTSTIVLWRERGALHAGFRSRFGDWTEGEIAPAANGALVETDGNEFVVVVNRDGQPSVAMGIGNDGRRRWSARLPLRATDIAWNGQFYGVIGMTDRTTAALRLSRDGVAGPAVEVLDVPSNALLASDGNGFMAGYLRDGAYLGTRMNAAFRVMGTVTFERANEIRSPDLIWDGSHYVATWIGANGVMASTEGTRERLDDFVNATLIGEVTAVRTRDGFGVIWRDIAGETIVLREPNRRIVRPPLHSPKRTRLVTLPDGRLAIVRESVTLPGHRDGRSRITMSIADITAPPVPEPPVVEVSSIGNVYVIRWTHSGRSVNGFRIEYRAGDGPVVELDRWFDANERAASIGGVEGVPYVFTVRAYGDGGTAASN